MIDSSLLKVSTGELDWEASTLAFIKSGLILYPAIIAAPWTCKPLTNILPQLNDNPSVNTIVSVCLFALPVSK